MVLLKVVSCKLKTQVSSICFHQEFAYFGVTGIFEPLIETLKYFHINLHVYTTSYKDFRDFMIVFLQHTIYGASWSLGLEDYFLSLKHLIFPGVFTTWEEKKMLLVLLWCLEKLLTRHLFIPQLWPRWKVLFLGNWSLFLLLPGNTEASWKLQSTFNFLETRMPPFCWKYYPSGFWVKLRFFKKTQNFKLEAKWLNN